MFLLSHDLSQVHRKGDLGDEVDGMKRKRRRRLQRVPEAFERCSVCHASQITFSFPVLCFSFRELADEARGLVASAFVLLSTVRYALIRLSITPLLFRTRPSHVGDIALV